MKITYKPEDVGKVVINNRGRKTVIRKYHMTDKEKKFLRNRWLLSNKDINSKLFNLAGKKFFNPYREGIYHYQVQALFLLGCNKWHSLSLIIKKLSFCMSNIEILYKGRTITAWEGFRGKEGRFNARICKDYIGRVKENMIFFQRLSGFHPSGYKLRQVGAAIDIKRVSKAGFNSGSFYYRLSTYNDIRKALPIRDFSKFKFPMHKNRYIHDKFIGTIICDRMDKSDNKTQLKIILE